MDTIKNALKPGRKNEDDTLGSGSSSTPMMEAGDSKTSQPAASTSSGLLPEFKRTQSGTISGLSSDQQVANQHDGAAGEPAVTSKGQDMGNQYSPDNQMVGVPTTMNEGTQSELPDRTVKNTHSPNPAAEATSGRTDGREALARAAAGTTAAGYGAHDHMGHGHKFEGDPCDSTASNEPQGAVQHTSGPHATDTANRLDPHFHMPGEFPDDEPAPDGGAHAHTPSTTAQSAKPTSEEHHYGRDAALGGTGVATAGGALAAGSSRTGPSEATNLPSEQLHSSREAMRGEPATGDGPVVPARDSSLAATPERAQPTSDEHHSGRNAALAGTGAAAASSASSLYSQDRNDRGGAMETDPVSAPAKPYRTHVTNVEGPHVLPESHKQNDNNTTMVAGDNPNSYSASEMNSYLNRIDGSTDNKQPTTKNHHYGRDAAIAGGGGAATATAVEATRRHDHTHEQAEPSTAHKTNQGAGEPPLPPSYVMGSYDNQLFDPTTKKQSPKTHHYGRDAALAGGAGAAGIGTYESAKGHGDKSNAGVPLDGTNEKENVSNQHHYGRDAMLAGGAGAAGTGAYEANKHHRDDSGAALKSPTTAQPDQSQSHEGRDAAAVAGTGAAGAGAVHEHSKYDPDKAAKEHQKVEKAHEKDIAKHQKELEKEDKKHQKELEKEEKKHHKEAEKEEKTPRKSGFFSNLLHKKDKTPDKSPENSHENVAEAGAAGAAATGAGAYEGEEHHTASPRSQQRHNKLHKEPPKDHPAAQYHTHHNVDSQGSHMGTDGSPNAPTHVSGSHGTQAGEYGAGDPTAEQSGVVREPHTGLPMHVGKYGDGHGGTDGAQNIAGAGHLHSGEEHPADWEAIRKANTPY